MGCSRKEVWRKRLICFINSFDFDLIFVVSIKVKNVLLIVLLILI